MRDRDIGLFMVGVVCGALLMGVFAWYVGIHPAYDEGKAACEAGLPRDQECKMVFIVEEQDQ